MGNGSSFELAVSSRSLLALKRFLRGSFRHIGVACLALVLVLNVTMQTPSAAAESGIEGEPSIALQSAPEISVSPTSILPTGERSESLTSVRSATLAPVLLQPHLTHHRLTSARLSVPHASEQQIASLASPRK